MTTTLSSSSFGTAVMTSPYGNCEERIGRLLALVGLVLVLLALKRISDETNRGTIFKDFLIAVIFTMLVTSWYP